MAWGSDDLFRSSRRLSRNVVVSGRRTSMRLESSLWAALEEIARREGGTVHDLCTLVDMRRGEMSLTAAVRAGLVHYFWNKLKLSEGSE